MTPLVEEQDRPTHLRFVAGGAGFELPLPEVGEVVVPPSLAARIPRTRAPFRGAVNLRGKVIALVELAGLLGRPAAATDPALARAILLEGTAMAIVVDEVTGFSAGEPAEGDGPERLSTSDLLARVERLLHPGGAALGHFPAHSIPSQEPTWPSAS
ncbi:MAG TPA: chemotaxis protein CheW [Vulgatibacter sp.]|nr:chemotaxis protein CheW [Vulgatibacter sp.]